MSEINHKVCVPVSHGRVGADSLRLSVVALAFVFAYAPTVPLLLSTWSYPDFSHGIMVPFVSLYLVWINRASMKGLPFEPNWPAGVIVTLAGAALLLLGTTASVVIVEEASVIVMIPGLILLLLGTRYMKALALPVGYLVLMVPVLTPFLEQLYWPLQLVTAELAALMLKAAGVPVFHSAQFLDLPNITLEVAEACSGAQFLISVLAIAIPMAAIALKGRGQRAALFSLAVLVTVFSNGLRVALIGYLAYVYDKKSALHGPYHILTGYFVFMVGFVFLFIGAWAILRLTRKTPAPERAERPLESQAAAIYCAGKGFKTACALAVVTLLGAGAFVYTYRPVAVPLKRAITELPLSIGQWRGERVGFDTDEMTALGADDEATWLFSNGGESLKLYIGYFSAQTQDRELVHARFTDLYREARQIDVTLASGERVRVNSATLKDGATQSYVLFWYDINGRTVASRHQAKLLTAVNGVLHRRTNGAVVMLKGPGAPQASTGAGEDFIRQLQPRLKDYLPSA